MTDRDGVDVYDREWVFIDACDKVLQRTCEAVALILDTADALREREEAVA